MANTFIRLEILELVIGLVLISVVAHPNHVVGWRVNRHIREVLGHTVLGGSCIFDLLTGQGILALLSSWVFFHATKFDSESATGFFLHDYGRGSDHARRWWLIRDDRGALGRGLLSLGVRDDLLWWVRILIVWSLIPHSQFDLHLGLLCWCSLSISRLDSSLVLVNDFIGTIGRFLLLGESRDGLRRVLRRLRLRVDDRLLNFGSDNFASELVALELRFVILKETLEHVSAVLDGQYSFALTLAVNESSSVNETILGEGALALRHTLVQLSGETSSIFVLNSAVTVGRVIFKSAFDNVAVSETELTFAVSKVAAPLSFIIQIGVVSAAVGALTLAFTLSIDPITVVGHATLICAFSFTIDLTLNEVANEAGSVLH